VEPQLTCTMFSMLPRNLALIDDDDPGAAVELHYTVDEGEVTIVVDGAADRPPEAVSRFHTLVTALVDRADLDLATGQVRLTKRHRHN